MWMDGGEGTVEEIKTFAIRKEPKKGGRNVQSRCGWRGTETFNGVNFK